MEPSPTADATRFTEPCRTSPPANTPGMLVSRANGLRSSGHVRGDTSAPVRMKPCGSRSMSEGSQSVQGCAPISRNRACASTRRLGAGREIAQDQMLEPPVSTTADHFGAEAYLDVLRRLDLVDQVLRHLRAQRTPSDHERDPARIAGEMEHGLSGGVGAPDDEHVAAGERRRLRRRSAVEHPGPGQAPRATQPRAAGTGRPSPGARPWSGRGCRPTA